MQPKTFTKMHGLGNDFIILDCREIPFDWTHAEIAALADRHCGIGFDQLLIIERPHTPDVDFTYRIFNADGGEVEHCGNGARCFGKYLSDRGLFAFSRPARVQVKKGIINIRRESEKAYTVDMDVPDFTPFTDAQQSRLYQPIAIAGEERQFAILSMGNPHAVCTVEDTDTVPVETIGKALQTHPLFPERVNVGFMQILDRQHIRLRVFERGVGETQACGTGACAAAAAGIARGDLDSPVAVQVLGGTITIRWAGEGSSLTMTGEAASVYRGELPAAGGAQ